MIRSSSFWNDESVKKKLDKFAQDIVNGFTRKRVIDKITQIKDYNVYLDKKTEFVQIAERFLMDANDFIEPVELTTFAEDYGMSIASGERKYFIDTIKKLIKNRTILKGFTLNQLKREVLTCRFRPTDIFLPIKYFSDLHTLYDIGEIIYENSQLYFLSSTFRIRVHWSNKYVPFEEIIIMNNESTEFAQKRISEMVSVNSIVEYQQISGYNYLEIKAGLKTTKLDVTIRSVIGLRRIDETKFKIIRIE